MKKSIYSRRNDALLALLRQVREEAGLYQAEVAARLSKPQSFISKCERGERRLDLVELESVCEAIGISLQDFVKRYCEM